MSTALSSSRLTVFGSISVPRIVWTSPCKYCSLQRNKTKKQTKHQTFVSTACDNSGRPLIYSVVELEVYLFTFVWSGWLERVTLSLLLYLLLSFLLFSSSSSSNMDAVRFQNIYLVICARTRLLDGELVRILCSSLLFISSFLLLLFFSFFFLNNSGFYFRFSFGRSFWSLGQDHPRPSRPYDVARIRTTPHQEHTSFSRCYGAALWSA